MYPHFTRSSSELVELLGTGQRPYANNGALVRRSGEHGSRRVDREERDRGLVCLDDICNRLGHGAEDEYVARL